MPFRGGNANQYGRGGASGGSRGYGGGFAARGRGGQMQNRRGGFAEPDPPEYVEEVAEYIHACEDKLLFAYNKKPYTVPRFNALVYTRNKVKMGRIDDVLGTTSKIMFSVIPETGVEAKSLEKGFVLCISPSQITPLNRFTDPPRTFARRGRGGGPGGPGRGRGGPMRSRGGDFGRGRAGGFLRGGFVSKRF